MTIEFQDGISLQFEMPRVKVGGTMWGDRSTRYVGVVSVKDEKNTLKGIVKIGGKINKKK